jgi:biotin synthase
MVDFNNLTAGSIHQLLTVSGAEKERLFERARETRYQYFGDNLQLRAVIEISNYCDCNCCYCGMRKDNRELSRNRLFFEDTKPVIQEIHDLGIRKIILQSGQDAAYPLDELCKITSYARRVGIENVIICFGIMKAEDYQELLKAGATGYILKFETSNALLYKMIKPKDTLEERLENIRLLKQLGYAVGSGNICGLPKQTNKDLADDIMLLKDLKVDMASVAPFISNKQSPYKDFPNGNVDITLNIIAIMRILLKDALIPSISAMETAQSGAQLEGYRAGANVITINMTPQHIREQYLIYDSKRKITSLEFARNIADTLGLKLNIQNKVS